MLPVAALHLTYGSALAPSSFHRVPVLSSGPAASSSSSSSSSSHASPSCDSEEKDTQQELGRAPSDAPELPFVLWYRTLSRGAPVPLAAVSLVPRGEPPPAGSKVVNGSLGHVSDLALCACPLLRAGAGAAGAAGAAGNAGDADARVVLDLRVVQGEGAVPGFDRVTPGIAVSSGGSEGGGSGGGGGGGGGEALVYLHVKSGMYDAAAASGGAGGRGIRVG